MNIMKWYKRSFFIIAMALMMILCLDLLSTIFVVDFDIERVVFAICLILSILGMTMYLEKYGKFSLEVSFGFIAVLWSFLTISGYESLISTIDKIKAVGFEKIFERIDIFEFLLDLLIKLIFFIPLTICLILGIYILVKKYGKRSEAKG